MGEKKKGQPVSLPVSQIQAQVYLGGDPERAVERALEKLEDPQFATELDSQVAAVSYLHELWPTLGEENQTRLLEAYAQVLPRCQRSRTPHKTLRGILRLKDEQDRIRALAVGSEEDIPWIAEAGEDIYPAEGFIGRYLEYAKHNGSHLSFHFWSILTILGSLAHRFIYVDAGQFYIYMNNYVVLTGASDSGKSVALDNAKGLIGPYNDRLLEKYKGQPHERSIFRVAGDITVPALVSTLGNQQYHYLKEREDGSTYLHTGQKDACGLMLLDEIASFLSQDAHGVRLKVPFLTTVYHGSRYEKTTNRDGTMVLEKPGFSFLGLGAPEWFRGNVTADFRQGGLLDRMMFVHREKTRRCYTIPLNPLDPVGRDALVDEMVELAHTGLIKMRADRAGTIYFKSWFKQRFYDLEEKGLDADSEEGGRSLNRTTGMIYKIAALISWSSGRAPWITDGDFDMAKIIVMAENESLLKLLAVVDESDRAPVFDEILRYIASQKGCCKKTPITRRFYRRKFVSDSGIDSFLDVLVESGQIRAVNTGRTMVYALEEHEECPYCKIPASAQKVTPIRRGA